MGEVIRVLHVAGDPSSRTLHSSSLADADDRLEVVTATSGRDGLDVLDTSAIDCIVSVGGLPDMSGLELLEAVRERDDSLPFLLYTVDGSDGDASEAISAGVTDYLQIGGGEIHYDLLATRILDAVSRYRDGNARTESAGAPERRIDDDIGLDVLAGMHAIVEGVDDGHVIVRCTTAFADRLGYDREQLAGRRLESLLDDSPSTGLELGGNGASDGETGERFLETASGDRVRMRIQSGRWPDSDQRATRYLCSFVDDSRIDELEAERDFYETILNTVPDAVYALDDDMHYLFVNEGMAELTGYSQEKIIGSHKSLVNTEESVKSGAVKRLDLAEHHRDGVKVAIHPHVTADGEKIPTEVRFSLLPAPGDEFRGTAGVVRDVTERLERERELERKNRRLDEFASVVSHDLRNPINVAEGRIELAKESCDCGETTEHLTKATDAIERMKALIDDVLSFAREGEAVTEFEQHDIGTIARSAWEAVGHDDATLIVEDDAPISGKGVRLQRLFENLIRNAREHAGPTVTVRVGTIPDGFYIEDDGPGIPDDQVDEIFEPGVTTATDGTGFGLAIVKSIVESHGWTISVTESDQGGARFEIRGLDDT